MLLLIEHLRRPLSLGRRQMKGLLLLRIDVIHALQHYLLLLAVLPLNDAVLHLMKLVPKAGPTQTTKAYLKYL